MSLAEWIMAGIAYADIVDVGGAQKPAPSNDNFDEMLARAREIGFLNDEAV